VIVTLATQNIPDRSPQSYVHSSALEPRHQFPCRGSILSPREMNRCAPAWLAATRPKMRIRLDGMLRRLRNVIAGDRHGRERARETDLQTARLHDVQRKWHAFLRTTSR
jgi:hypothetical protein